VKLLRDLCASFAYFSILPVPQSGERPGKGAIVWLPLVGGTIGLIAGLAGAGIFKLSAFWSYPALIATWILCIALSGAIHVDGFLDCCDGLFAMTSPQRRLEIMHDPRHGTYALVGMMLLGFGWFGALNFAAPVPALPMLLAFSGIASRAFAAAAARVLPWPALVIIAPMIAYYQGQLWKPLCALGAGALAALLTGLFAWRRLGGKLNGDCYGAIAVLSEVTMLYALGFLKIYR